MKINNSAHHQLHDHSTGLPRPQGPGYRAGLTLVEIAVVIAVAVSLIGILFVGAKTWKEGSDRAACVMNIYRVQVAVRSHANICGFYEGQDVSNQTPDEGLFGQLIGPGKYLVDTPRCRRDGLYVTNGDIIPVYGELYMACSLGRSEKHVPNDSHAW
jgi:hypothetical protein